MHRFAIYDLDKTITYAPTWTSFLLLASRLIAPWRLLLLPVLGAVTIGYALKLVGRGRLKELAHALLIGPRVPVAKLEAVAALFAEGVVPGETYAGARARIAADRAEGYEVLIATASYALYVRAIAERLGVGTVIGTLAEVRDGYVLARISGENCYGPAKLRMIEAWLAGQGIARGEATVRFYSDHVSDAPTLAWADEAFAVNAHAPLREMAKARGWAVVDWERQPRNLLPLGRN
ncbi:HAD family hydrolase [Sphingomonas immobilis]|uniref:HAD-IB family phosphatase n=1 Tax=Sphingomonas immobilis TaxID=3063997 RepID=A0ABT9A305_9SPHN|nr:HAD-IB family phosphatase [Sphingomonas sp. CA1-15]MDO7843112.1 HAD-IB family phosphatase [Sphingomonas sp. CA1-15]